MVTELEAGASTVAIQGFDTVVMVVMRAVTMVLPNYADIDTTRYVADGYYIPFDLIGQHFLITAAVVFVITILGYFLLKTREIAA
jgi:uncharacterized phage infection (PIP) family protein YhgE